MKKLMMVFIGVFTAGCAYAFSMYQISGDATVTTTRTKVYGMVVNYKGVAVGDKVEFKNNGTGSGTVVLTVIAPTANGSFGVFPNVDFDIDGGLYQDQTVTTGGFTSDIIYQ